MVGNRVVNVLSSGGGSQVTFHTVAEHLVIVQVYETAELVAERENQTCEVLHTGHVEGLLVELNGVGRVGIRVEGSLRPAGKVRAEPVLRHIIHVIIPLRLEANGVDSGEVTRF